MKTRDNEINFYAEVTPEEFENEFLEKEKLFPPGVTPEFKISAKSFTSVTS